MLRGGSLGSKLTLAIRSVMSCTSFSCVLLRLTYYPVNLLAAPWKLILFSEKTGIFHSRRFTSNGILYNYRLQTLEELCKICIYGLIDYRHLWFCHLLELKISRAKRWVGVGPLQFQTGKK